MAKGKVSRNAIGRRTSAISPLSRRALSWSAGAAITAILLSGCAVIGFLFMPKAADDDIRAGFSALAKAHAWAQEGKTVVTAVPSVTTYTSADGTVTLEVELKDGAPSPFPTEINSYAIDGFKHPDSDIVVDKAEITVTNATDGWGETTKDEVGFADFGSAATLERLDFALNGKYPAWGEGIDYEFNDGGEIKANYKDVGYLRVPMIY